MADQKKVDEILRKAREALKEQPEVSDADFMAEFEVSDAEYKRGFTLPGVGMKKTKGKK
jgi:hypothetical protein